MISGEVVNSRNLNIEISRDILRILETRNEARKFEMKRFLSREVSESRPITKKLQKGFHPIVYRFMHVLLNVSDKKKVAKNPEYIY